MLTNWHFYILGVHLASFFSFENMDRSWVASISDRTQNDGTKSSRFGRSLTGRPIGELSEQEFYARFYIPNFISI